MRAPDPALLYGQVEKTREGRRVTKAEKKLVLGPPATDLAFVSTSLLERQNGTARSRNRYMVRKTYAFAKLVPYMDDQCEVDKTFYNFCREHRGPRQCCRNCFSGYNPPTSSSNILSESYP
jgi:hypothetical protein